jgi:hypothetical protein
MLSASQSFNASQVEGRRANLQDEGARADIFWHEDWKQQATQIIVAYSLYMRSEHNEKQCTNNGQWRNPDSMADTQLKTQGPLEWHSDYQGLFRLMRWLTGDDIPRTYQL